MILIKIIVMFVLSLLVPVQGFASPSTSAVPGYLKLKEQFAEVASQKSWNPNLKKLLLVGFASWCDFCRGEMPKINQLAKDYQKCGLQVLGLGIEKEKSKTEEAIKSWPIQLQVVFDLDFKIKNELEIKKIPALFYYDQSAKLILKAAGSSSAEQIYQLIRTDFGEKPCR